MKKRLIVIKTVVALVVCGLLILLISGYMLFWKPLQEEQDERSWLPGEKEAYILNELYPTDIIWYGKQYAFDFEVPVRYETEISMPVLKKRSGYTYVYIVLSDRDGQLDISRENLELIEELVRSDIRYNFIYIGDKENDILKELAPDGVNFELTNVSSYSELHNGKDIDIWLNDVPRDLDDDDIWQYVCFSLAEQISIKGK